MRRTPFFFFAFVCLVLSHAQPVLADPLTDAETAIMARDYASALAILKPLAEQGHALAQLHLGYLSGTGNGVPLDNVEGAKWFLKAAEQGVVPAQVTVGNMFAQGLGIKKDQTEAARWYRKAAERGCPPAMTLMGMMYAEGKGVLQDQSLALRWWQQGANLGDPRALRLIRKARAQGSAPLQPAEATRALRALAEHGDSSAQSELGTMYLKGDGVRQDFAEAMKWSRMAADAGIADAQAKVGTLYAQGAGIERDVAEAIKWYRKAAEQGHTYSQYFLGLLHFQGQGVIQKDYVQAHMWLDLAASNSNGMDSAATLRHSLAKEMTPAQLTQARQLAREWKPKTAQQP